ETRETGIRMKPNEPKFRNALGESKWHRLQHTSRHRHRRHKAAERSAGAWKPPGEMRDTKISSSSNHGVVECADYTLYLRLVTACESVGLARGCNKPYGKPNRFCTPPLNSDGQKE